MTDKEFLLAWLSFLEIVPRLVFVVLVFLPLTLLTRSLGTEMPAGVSQGAANTYLWLQKKLDLVDELEREDRWGPASFVISCVIVTLVLLELALAIAIPYWLLSSWFASLTGL